MKLLYQLIRVIFWKSFQVSQLMLNKSHGLQESVESQDEIQISLFQMELKRKIDLLIAAQLSFHYQFYHLLMFLHRSLVIF